MAASGSSPSKEKGQLSSSRSLDDNTPIERARVRLVIIEDNKADIFLVKEAIAVHQLNAELSVIMDGEKAVRMIEEGNRNETAPIPDLILLDLNLPKRGGHEVLADLKRSEKFAQVPVLIMTSSDAPRDREVAARLGGSGYFQKPNSYDEFLEIGKTIKSLLPDQSLL